VTEVPEHLLRRSRERREALGLGGGGGDEGESAAPAPSAAPPATTPAVAVTGEVAEGAGSVATLTEEPPEPPAPVIARRPKTPFWMITLLVLLPVYAWVYTGAFGARHAAAANDPVTLGSALFTANCSACHGANGEGGIGPQLAGGSVLRTWPNVSDHINWVHTGGAPFVGKTYGSQGHTVTASNVMPPFGQDHGGSLSDAQIVDVVCYERIGLSGAPATAANCPALAGASSAAS
jgi:mono/diheme cytochrome c family protein